MIGVKKNPQSNLYTQLGVITKGTIIEVLPIITYNYNALGPLRLILVKGSGTIYNYNVYICIGPLRLILVNGSGTIYNYNV